MLSSTRTLYRHALTLAFAVLLTAGCAFAAHVSGYKVVAKFPHSTDSYTEGFFYLNGLFYEGTGLKGHSEVMAVQPATGKALQEVDLSPSTSARASSTGARISTSGPGSRTSALSTTASAPPISSSPTPARAGA